MPIPDFDHNNVLPPHLGNPAIPSDLSPYPATTLEFVIKFATSSERIEILRNFIEFRSLMNVFRIVDGFQWLDGSFLQDIESSESRPPNDLDLVTFYKGISTENLFQFRSDFPEFVSPQLSKQNFKLDHYGIDFGYSPQNTVEQTRYWIQLFSHRRQDMVWKGMVRLQLNTPQNDHDALEYLNSL